MFDSLREALQSNNSDGLDGRDVSSYRFHISGRSLPLTFECTALLWPSGFYLASLGTFCGETCDETRELKVYASSEHNTVIIVKNTTHS
eukprot:12260401-Ditylum_brightwellii.AAC.1